MKSKSTQQTTNTYGWNTPPKTVEQQAFDSYAQNSGNEEDPSIPYQFGLQRKNAENRFANPFGAGFSPEVMDAMRYNDRNNIDQAQGEAQREDYYKRQGLKGSLLAQSAGMNAPTLTQTGGNSVGTQTQPIGPAIIGAVGGAGSAYLG